MQSLDRNRRGHSQRSARAQSVARFDDTNQSRGAPKLNVRDYTMTLPASRGRHRSRIYGKYGFLFLQMPIQILIDNNLFLISIFVYLLSEKRARSVDPRIQNSKDDAPVLCNKYAIDALLRKESLNAERQNRSKSMPRSQSFRKSLYTPSREPSPEQIPKRLHASERSRYLAPPLPPIAPMPSDDECIELEVPEVTPPERRKQRRFIKMPPSPRIMSPMGFAVHRQARLVMESFDEEAGCDDDYVDYVTDAPVRPVPIWLCVFLVIGYIIAGAFYFKRTEKWEFLDSACK